MNGQNVRIVDDFSVAAPTDFLVPTDLLVLLDVMPLFVLE